jgi:hypothetical protein
MLSIQLSISEQLKPIKVWQGYFSMQGKHRTRPKPVLGLEAHSQFTSHILEDSLFLMKFTIEMVQAVHIVNSNLDCLNVEQ